MRLLLAAAAALIATACAVPINDVKWQNYLNRRNGQKTIGAKTQPINDVKRQNYLNRPNGQKTSGTKTQPIEPKFSAFNVKQFDPPKQQPNVFKGVPLVSGHEQSGPAGDETRNLQPMDVGDDPWIGNSIVTETQPSPQQVNIKQGDLLGKIQNDPEGKLQFGKLLALDEKTHTPELSPELQLQEKMWREQQMKLETIN